MLSFPRCPVVQCVRHRGDIWSELLYDICYLLSSVVISVRVPESGVFITSPVRTECGMCDVLYTVLFVRVNYFVSAWMCCLEEVYIC